VSASLSHGRPTLESKLAVKTCGTSVQQVARKDCMERPWLLSWVVIVCGGREQAKLSMFPYHLILFTELLIKVKTTTPETKINMGPSKGHKNTLHSDCYNPSY
jgi:hypothetical protein